MTKTDTFWETIIDVTEWDLIDIYKGEELCVCGTRIKTVYKIKHKITGQQANIGGLCVKRFNFGDPRSKQGFLALAKQMAANEWERSFVQTIQDDLVKYGRKAAPTERQVEILERILNPQMGLGEKPFPWVWNIREKGQQG